MQNRIEELKKIIERATKFQNIERDKLNEKPSGGGWSIGQCIQHLLVSNQTYIPVFEQIAAGKYKSTFWQQINPFTKLTGKNMVSTLSAEVKKKFIAPKLFQPSKKEISPDVITSFISQQEQLIKLFEELQKEKYKNVIISSPAATLITLRLTDAMDLLIVHAQRHLEQAERVI